MSDKDIKLYVILDGKEYAIKGSSGHCAIAMERLLHYQLGYMDSYSRWVFSPTWLLRRYKRWKLRRSNPLITLSTGKVMRKTRIYSEYDIEKAVGEIVGLI